MLETRGLILPFLDESTAVIDQYPCLDPSWRLDGLPVGLFLVPQLLFRLHVTLNLRLSRPPPPPPAPAGLPPPSPREGESEALPHLKNSPTAIAANSNMVVRSIIGYPLICIFAVSATITQEEGQRVCTEK